MHSSALQRTLDRSMVYRLCMPATRISHPHRNPIRPSRQRAHASSNGIANDSSIPPAAASKAKAANSRTTKPQKMTIFKALSFDGPAPELVNCRLAMVGLVWGACTEFQTGELMLSQAQHISLPAIAVCLLFTYATMVPVMHSARMEPFGFFTPRAELTNGRAAMVGFLCILALEYKTGVPFF